MGQIQKGKIALLIGGLVLVSIATGCGGSSGGAPGPGSVALSGTATERALCAALDGPVSKLPALIDAEANDAESGMSLGLEGASLELHLSMTNNSAKVAQDISDMRDTCNSQAG